MKTSLQSLNTDVPRVAGTLSPSHFSFPPMGHESTVAPFVNGFTSWLFDDHLPDSVASDFVHVEPRPTRLYSKIETSSLVRSLFEEQNLPFPDSRQQRCAEPRSNHPQPSTDSHETPPQWLGEWDWQLQDIRRDKTERNNRIHSVDAVESGGVWPWRSVYACQADASNQNESVEAIESEWQWQWRGISSD